MNRNSRMVESYLEAMAWADCNEDQDEAFSDASFSDELIEQAVKDCTAFRELISEDQMDAYQEAGHGDEQMGHDFWLTRGGHGVGFWDRGLGELGDQLSDLTKNFRSLDCYVGDDGLIYAA